MADFGGAAPQVSQPAMAGEVTAPASEAVHNSKPPNIAPVPSSAAPLRKPRRLMSVI